MKIVVALFLATLSLAACGGQGQPTPSPRISSTPVPRPPTDTEIAGYAQSVGITVTCAKAYLAAHKDQFPNSVKELADFKASAPPQEHCA